MRGPFALFNRVLWAGLALLSALSTSPSWAHKGSDAYLDVQQQAATSTADADAYSLTLSVAIKDLDLALPVDANADGQVTWGEVKAAMPQVLVLLNATAQTDSPATAVACRLAWQADGVERRSDGAYLRFVANTQCAAGQALALRYTLFSQQDATHRLLVAGRTGGQDLLTTASPQQTASIVLKAASPGGTQALGARPAATLSGPQPANRWSALRDYFLLGAHHLLEGYDHMAFLLALVLPLQLRLGSKSGSRTPTAPSTALVSSSSRTHPQSRTGNVWFALLRTVTAFTIGHSITLMLATFGVTEGSPTWVEPVIALSIGVTAALNLWPVPWLRVELLALAFGLVHGYGFAGLLQEAAAPTALLPWALAGFNLGVEAGQLIAVSVWVAVSQLVVAKVWYPSVVVRGGSVMLILVAAFWFWQRVV